MALTLPDSTMQLEIRKMPEGGYAVCDGYGERGDWRQMRFASTSIEEALRFIKSKLEPKEPAKQKIPM